MILLIETSHRICSVAVCDLEGTCIWQKQDDRLLKHAEALPILVKEAVDAFKDIKAIGLSKGPGSYTGLRIGASLAQGLCYAKEWPLIGIPTHRSLIDHAIQKNGNLMTYCAMIYAGRDEAYTAFWDGSEMSKIKPKNFTKEYMSSLDDKLCFTGDCMHLLGQEIAKERTLNVSPHARLLASIAAAKWKKNDFEDLAYYRPLYAKDFIPGVSKKFKL